MLLSGLFSFDAFPGFTFLQEVMVRVRLPGAGRDDTNWRVPPSHPPIVLHHTYFTGIEIREEKCTVWYSGMVMVWYGMVWYGMVGWLWWVWRDIYKLMARIKQSCGNYARIYAPGQSIFFCHYYQ